MKLLNLCKSITMVLLLLVGTYLQAQNTIKGTVKDDSGESLIGASILVEGTSTGTTTDFDGNFSLGISQNLPVNLIVSYTGYKSATVAVSSGIGNLSIILEDGGINLDEVVISASRRREKVQEAPASISVINAKKLAVTSNSTDPTRNLVNTAGVQIQQQSANRINISMRGGAGLFGTSVFPIMDYRSLVGPGIGTFQSDQAGISNIDLQRIEVVRGPGSALYGPGVTQGVVHFITKNPIDFPGTAIEVLGGQLNTFGGTVRHATKVNDKFGFKINASYKRGDEFTLDPTNPDDAAQIGRMTTNGVFRPAIKGGIVDPTGTPIQVLTQEDLDPDGDGNPMSPDWNNALINATLEFRPQDDLSVFLSGGMTNARAVFYNEQGEGFSHANEYWAQARMQKGGFFAQVFGVSNDGGLGDKRTSFLYQTGNVSAVARTQLETQLQYNFDTPNILDGNWTAGFDYRFSGQKTDNLVYGRNEDDDSYSVVGAYLQGKFAVLDKLDLVVAGRYDRFNFIDDGAFAPRAALVYKAAPGHTFRASYNRSNSTVSNLQLNIDFPLSTIIPGSFDAWLYGNKTTQTFGDSPMISWFNGLIPSVPVGTPGLPLGVPFALANEQVLQGLIPLLPADLAPLIENILRTGIDPNTLGTTGTLSPGFNIFDGSPLGLIDAPISQISTHDNWEVGYKGLIGDKLGVMLDIYRVTQRNTSQFTAISPAYVLFGYETMPGDLGAAVAAQATPQIEQALLGLGLPAEQAAATATALGASIGGAYTLGGDGVLNTPSESFGGLTLAQVLGALPFHATVSTQEVPDNGVTHLAAGYRTFDERTFWGADLGLEYYINGDLSLFGNYSWVSDTEFMQNVVGVEGEPLPTYLNIPKNKFRLGLNYTPDTGIRGSLAFQHDDSYFASAGQYSGTTDARNLLDASIGYALDNGLTIDVSGTNVLGTEYRYLPNMPMIGRRVLAKLTYTFGEGK